MEAGLQQALNIAEIGGSREEIAKREAEREKRHQEFKAEEFRRNALSVALSAAGGPVKAERLVADAKTIEAYLKGQ